MDTKERTKMEDEALLNAFFTEHTEHIGDAGFTDLILAALPEGKEAQTPVMTDAMRRTIRLKRWTTILNLLALASCIALLFLFDTFGLVGEWLHVAALQFLRTLHAIDPGTLLVRLMLFLYHLPGLLPSLPQLFIISVVFIAAIIISLDRLLNLNYR